MYGHFQSVHCRTADNGGRPYRNPNFRKCWNIFQAVGSGYAVQLQGDVTFKASKAAPNKLGFGVKMLGTCGKSLCSGHLHFDTG